MKGRNIGMTETGEHPTVAATGNLHSSPDWPDEIDRSGSMTYLERPTVLYGSDGAVLHPRSCSILGSTLTGRRPA